MNNFDPNNPNNFPLPEVEPDQYTNYGFYYNLADFDEQFKNYKEQHIKRNQTLDEERLKKLSEQATNASSTNTITNYTLSQMMSGIWNSWYGMINDLLNQPFSFDIFVKDNRLFFIGLSLLIVIFIILIIYVFTYSETK